MLTLLVLTGAVAIAAPAPSPCPTAVPTHRARSAGAATPCPTPTHALKDIASVKARGRIDNLIGVAGSASEGYVGHSELEQRPILRPGELMETVPGVVISQHSGEGKANQYYLRGFNLDHGTDIAITIAGIPANMRTHAHGQGYSDVNWIIPEVVNYINYRKGTYYADQGDFSTAGAVDMKFFNVLPRNVVSFGAGPYGYGRLLLASSPKLGTHGHLLYALEYEHVDNTADFPDNYRKYNGLVRYSHEMANSAWGITLQAYKAKWMSSDQIPLRAVEQGIIDRFGQIDPTDGGRTHRYALSADYSAQTENTSTQINAYALDYGLHLFSDFTYYLNDPVNMDQFEQLDNRLVTGLNASRAWTTPAGGVNTVGYQFRNDNIAPVSLYSTKKQRIIGTTRIDHVVESSHGIYAQTEQHFGRRFRVTAGVRGDVYDFNVKDLRPENSGNVHASIINPKLALAYEVSPQAEVYLDAGEGFHSNDARGVVQTVDPVTGRNVDPGTGDVISGATPLVRAKGAEIGARIALGQKLRTTLSLWSLNLDSELVFQGDSGTTSAGRPSRRSGVELANFWVPSPGLTYDLDFSTSSAHFTNYDPVGNLIPGAINDVLTFGAAYDPATSKIFGSIRLRYFGPRALIEDGSVHSKPTTTVSLQTGVKLAGRARLSLDVFNLLNTRASDIDYFYASYLPSDPYYTSPAYTGPCPRGAVCGQGVSDIHFHPIERRTIRFTLTLPT